MRCAEARLQLSALLDRDLEPEQVNGMRAHLATCSGCRAVYRQYADNQQQLVQFLQHAPYLPVAERVLARSRPAPRGSRRWSLARGSRQLLTGTALLLLVGLMAASVLAIREAGRQRGVTPATGGLGNAAPAVLATPLAATHASAPLAPSLATPVPATPAPATPEPVDQRLVALQAAAGFPLYAPTQLPRDVALAAPAAPMQLPGFTSLNLVYQDSNAQPVVSITEASPYQETRETMPSDIYDASQPVDLGDGFTARLYASAGGSLQLWWQRGPTAIRLETDTLTREQLLTVARSMAPLPASATPVALPADAALPAADDAVARARTQVAALGGRRDAALAGTRLTTLAEPQALGLAVAAGVDPATPVWRVEFADALVPAACPAAGSSVCSHGRLVVILDARDGQVLGWQADDGSWQRPEDSSP